MSDERRLREIRRLMDEAGRLRANLLDAPILLLDRGVITLSRAAEMYGVSLAEMRKLWLAKREGR